MIELDTKPLEKQLRKLLGGLKDLTKNEAKKVLNQASRAGAKVILPVARQLAPKRTGLLASQITVKALPRSRVWTGTQVRTGGTKKLEKAPRPLRPFKALKPLKALKVTKKRDASATAALQSAREQERSEKHAAKRIAAVAAYEQSKKMHLARIAKKAKYNNAFYFSFVEFGFKHRGGKKIHGQHFLQRAFRKTKETALKAAIDVARDGITKALERTKS